MVSLILLIAPPQGHPLSLALSPALPYPPHPSRPSISHNVMWPSSYPHQHPGPGPSSAYSSAPPHEDEHGCCFNEVTIILSTHFYRSLNYLLLISSAFYLSTLRLPARSSGTRQAILRNLPTGCCPKPTFLRNSPQRTRISWLWWLPSPLPVPYL